MDKIGETFDHAYGIFSPVEFFMGQLIGVKTPPKFHEVLCFKVRYLKTTTSAGVTFDKFHMGRKLIISWKEFTRIFQKMAGESPDFWQIRS
jgi:hypothetical protein